MGTHGSCNRIEVYFLYLYVMKTLLLFILLSFGGTHITNQTPIRDIQNNEDIKGVYICTGPQSKRYHYSSECRGLSNCSKKIISVSLSDAKGKYKRTLCGWED